MSRITANVLIILAAIHFIFLQCWSAIAVGISLKNALLLGRKVGGNLGQELLQIIYRQRASWYTLKLLLPTLLIAKIS